VAITIGSNIASTRAQRQLGKVSSSVESTYERLSSGSRINRASDDAAGLAIATGLSTRSRLYTRALLNVSDGISLLNVAESATESLSTVITRIRELAEQAANGNYSATQRKAIDKEAQALRQEFNRIKESATFNGQSLLDGELSDLGIFADVNGTATPLKVGIENMKGGEFTTGTALQTDGIDDSLVVEYDSSRWWGGEDITVEAVINIASTESDGGHIVSQAYNGAGEYDYRLFYTATGALGFSHSGANSSGGLGQVDLLTDTGLLQRETAHHIAFSYEASSRSLRLFVDGKKSLESTVPSNIIFQPLASRNNTPLAVGTVFPLGEGSGYPSTLNLQGQIDQVRISKATRYSDDFTPSLIQNNVEESTVLFLNFENRVGLTYRDLSRIGSTATARNGAANSAGFIANPTDLVGFNLLSRSDALDALDMTARVLESLSDARGKIGVSVSRLKATSNVLSALNVSTEEATARITDANVAEESAGLTRQQILQRVATAVLSQANVQPQIAVSLLQ
jgi:flagellin